MSGVARWAAGAGGRPPRAVGLPVGGGVGITHCDVWSGGGCGPGRGGRWESSETCSLFAWLFIAAAAATAVNFHC